jgi:hypothetical protein
MRLIFREGIHVVNFIIMNLQTFIEQSTIIVSSL